MKIRRLALLTPVALTPVALTPLAQAHPGHGPADFAGGFAHPFTGFDHLLAMLAVGLWAAQLGGRAKWALPVSFVASMLAGAAAGLLLGSGAAIEWGILASVLILGAAIAAAFRPPLWAGALLTSAAGLAHGIAHGAEFSRSTSSALPVLTGMIAATALLHAIGVLGGTWVQNQNQRGGVLRLAGAGIAAAGLTLLISR